MKSRREYFANRLRAIAEQYAGSLTPKSYNIALTLLPMYAALLQAGELRAALGAMRLAVDGRLKLIPQSPALIKENRQFRNAMINLIAEIKKSKDDDAELGELHWIVDLTRRATGITDSRTTLLEEVQMSYPLFLATNLSEAYRTYRESVGCTITTVAQR